MQPATIEDREQNARLHGLIAVLGLPPVRHGDGTWKRVPVEVEIKDGLWERVDGLMIESERLVFTFGANGTTVQFVFLRKEGVPRWRTPREPTYVVGFTGGGAG